MGQEHQAIAGAFPLGVDDEQQQEQHREEEEIEIEIGIEVAAELAGPQDGQEQEGEAGQDQQGEGQAQRRQEQRLDHLEHAGPVYRRAQVLPGLWREGAGGDPRLDRRPDAPQQDLDDDGQPAGSKGGQAGWPQTPTPAPL